MSNVATKAATYEDLLALPDDARAEIVGGTYGENAVARVAPFEQVELDVGRLSLPRAEGA